MSLKEKIILITGASRGIGRAIALKCAKEGAKALILAAKTADPHPALKGTIHTVANEVQALGAEAYPYQINLRYSEEIEKMAEAIEKKYGMLDILINNASAIDLTPTEKISLKKYDLMHAINDRASFICAKTLLPLLKKSDNAHILTMSPPIDLESSWFNHHTPYALSKFGMSLVTIGLSKEFGQDGILVNSLWPEKVIATAAIAVNFPQEVLKVSLKADIMADAAFEIFTNPKVTPRTGHCFLDHEVLKMSGKNYDLSSYEYGDTGAMHEEFLHSHIAKRIPKVTKDDTIPQNLEELTQLYDKDFS